MFEGRSGFKDKKYFMLKNEAICVDGKNGAAIYDFENKVIYSIDLRISKLIQKCAKGHEIEKSLRGVKGSEKVMIYDYLEKLANYNLGSFSDHYFIQELVPPHWSIKNRDNTRSMKLERLYIEICKSCNLDCIYCNDSNGRTSICSCTRLSTKKDAKPKALPLSILKAVIDDSQKLECKELIIMGGEPFIEKEELLMLIEFAQNKIPLIRIKSNLLLLDDDILHYLKRYRIEIETTFFSFEEGIYDQITNTVGNLKKWVENCRRLIENDVDIYVKIPLIYLNRDCINKNIEILSKIGIKREHISTSLVYSLDDKIWPPEHKDFLYKTIKHIKGISKDQYFNNREKNPCWFGKINITHEGSIVPCPIAKSFEIGNVKKQRLLDVLRRGLQLKYWTLTKDKIIKCKTCEFRYACSDCRPIESKDNSLTAENRFCTVY